jgi:hypothetical protein
MTLWCHGWGSKLPLTASHIHIECVYSDWAPSYAVDWHMGAPLHCYTGAGGGQILWNLGKVESKWRCGVMVEAVRWATADCISHPYWMYLFIGEFSLSSSLGNSQNCSYELHFVLWKLIKYHFTAEPPHYYYTNWKPLMWAFIWYPGGGLGPILEPKPSISPSRPSCSWQL